MAEDWGAPITWPVFKSNLRVKWIKWKNTLSGWPVLSKWFNGEMLFHAYKLRNHTLSLFYMETIVKWIRHQYERFRSERTFYKCVESGSFGVVTRVLRDSRFYLCSMVAEVDLFNYIHGLLVHDQFYHDCMKISCGPLYVKKSRIPHWQ